MKQDNSSMVEPGIENEQNLNETEKHTLELQTNNQESTINPHTPKNEENVFQRSFFEDVDRPSSTKATIINSVSSYEEGVLSEIENIMGELNSLVSTIDNKDVYHCKKGQHKKKLPKSSMENSKALRKSSKKMKNMNDNPQSSNSIKDESSEVNVGENLNASAPPSISCLPNISKQSPLILFTDSSYEMCTSLQIMHVSPRNSEYGITSVISEGYEYQEAHEHCSYEISSTPIPFQLKEPKNQENYLNKKTNFIGNTKSRKTFAVFRNRDASHVKSVECLKIKESVGVAPPMTPTTALITENSQPSRLVITQSHKEVKLNWFERLKLSTFSRLSTRNKILTTAQKSKVNTMTQAGSFSKIWNTMNSTLKAKEDHISNTQTISKVYARTIKLSNSYSKEKKSRQVEKNTIIMKLNQMMWADLSISDEAYTAILFKMGTCISLTLLEELSELLSICFKLCPPSQEFVLQIEAFLNRSLLSKFPDNEYFLATRDQILQMKSGIVSKGCPSPSVDFISQIRESIYNPSMFGISISDLMKLQAVRFPKLYIPWIIYILCNEIVARGGLEAEGIFRISGDTDIVSKIRLKLNKHFPVPSEANAYDCASTLKTWCRELPTPLIPDSLYSKCLENCNNPTEICDVIRSLNKEEQNCICFLVKFIRIFLDPNVIDKTRMPIENLSMIWAPSFLRSPSSDPIGVAAAISKEKSVTAIIITELNISSVKDLGITGKISIS